MSHALRVEWNNTIAQPKRKELTRRELEILKLILQELSNAQIATQLFISLYTVETHRKNILRKIGAKNMIGLARYAVERGFVRW